MLWRRGEGLLQAGRAAEAEGVFRELLARLDAGAAFDAGYQKATVIGDIGRCLRAQGRPEEAVKFHRRALEAWAQLEQTENVRRAAGVDHTDLGDVLTALGRYAEARAEYEESLKIKKAIGGDDRGEATVLFQMGTLAMSQKDLNDARRRYLEALPIFQRMGEERSEAIIWHQLGRVAQEGREWPEAERCYKESLAIEERTGDKALAATTCNQLANVAKGAGRPDEAERWYTRAQAIKDEISPHDASTLNNLADLLLAQGRLDEAERYAHRAREIKERLALSVEPWTTYTILSQIAAQRGLAAEARDWRRKARDTFAAFAGSWARLEGQFAPVVAAVVAAVNGDPQARAQVEAQFPRFESGNWQIVDAIQRIWAGERDLDALTEDLHYRPALIIRKILEGIAGVPGNAGVPPASTGPSPHHAGGTPAPQQGLTLDQLLALVARARAGDAALAGQLQPMFQMMASSADAPPEARALFAALAQVLGGETPDVSALPPELAEIVRGMG